MKDAVGNELKLGDLVALQLERPLIYGRVAAITEGGMIVAVKGGKQPEIHPSTVVISSNHTIQVDPRTPLIGSVICLREDNRPPEELVGGSPEKQAEERPN